jgi:hypothetical protein
MSIVSKAVFLLLKRRISYSSLPRMPLGYYRLHHAVLNCFRFNHIVEPRVISVLHPTRRPDIALERRRQWLESADKPELIEYIYAIDADDEQSMALLEGYRRVVTPPGGKAIRPINLAAQSSTGEILILAMDDVEAPRHWDAILRNRLARRKGKPSVLAVGDGLRKDRLAVTSILNRARYRALGFVLDPVYECCGLYADSEFTDCAYHDGVMVTAYDVIFQHHHPDSGKGEMDEVHKRHNNPECYRIGHELYTRRRMLR